MENPYQPPETDQNSGLPEGSRVDVMIARIAIWLYRAPLFAVVFMMFFMTFAFGTLSENGSAEPAKLAAEITRTVWISMLGLGLGLCGWVLALVSLFRPYPRRRPNYWSWIILSAVYAFFGFPIGTGCGLFLIGLVLKKRQQFFVQEVDAAAAAAEVAAEVEVDVDVSDD